MEKGCIAMLINHNVLIVKLQPYFNIIREMLQIKYFSDKSWSEHTEHRKIHKMASADEELIRYRSRLDHHWLIADCQWRQNLIDASSWWQCCIHVSLARHIFRTTEVQCKTLRYGQKAIQSQQHCQCCVVASSGR